MEDALSYLGDTEPAPAPKLPSKSEEKCNNVRFRDLAMLFEKIEKAHGSEHKLKLLFSKEMKKQMNGESLYPLLRLVLPTIDSERGKYGLKQAMVAKTYVQALHLDKSSEAASRLINWKDPSKAQGVEVSKMVVGDFGVILEDVLKSRVRSEFSDATLRDVNELLDSLAQAISTADKTAIIRDRILNQFSAVEQKWLARIIFSDLKIGLKHETVLNYFYPTALKRFNECVNLRLVCEEEGITTELSGVQLFVCYSPMLAKGFPQSSVGQITAVEAAMDQQPFIMDIKLDGERLAVHIGDENTSVMMFTRRRNDYSENYAPLGEIVRESVQIATGAGTRCILDGEVCAWDRASQCYLPFGNNANVRNKEREVWLAAKENAAAGGAVSSLAAGVGASAGASYGNGRNGSYRRASLSQSGASNAATASQADLAADGTNGRPPRGWDKDLPTWCMFVVFDILFLEGPRAERIIQDALQECGIFGRYVPPGEITNLPLIVRRAILVKVISPIPNRVDIVPSRIVTAQDTALRIEQIEAYFNEVTLAGEEGLVIKNLNGCYELGEKSRATALWVKMKPEYGDQMEDLDLLILGAYYGEGKGLRGKGISTFVCGVKDDRNPSIYHTVCKVGTGYSFDELLALRKIIAEISVPWQPGRPPAHLAHWKMPKKDTPNVYIPPEKSIVVQLKCAEIVPSANFSSGLCCRFPRIQCIRHDKAYTDIMSMRDLQDLKQQLRNTTMEVSQRGDGGGGRGRKKASQTQDDGTGTGAAASAAAAGTRKRGHCVDDQFRVSTKAVEQRGAVFEGSTYCVLESEFSYTTAAGVARKFTREDLIHIIRSQGGTVVASATTPDCQVIAGSKRTMQISNMIERGERDVIDFSYIIECTNTFARLPLKRVHLLGMSAATRARFRGTADPFGDSYTEEVLPDELSKILASFDRTIAALEKRHVGNCEALRASSSAGASGTAAKSRKVTAKGSASAGIATPGGGGEESAAVDSRAQAALLLRERAEEVAAVKDWRTLQHLGWRELAVQLTHEERDPLYNEWNALWQENVVLYLDESEDLGSCFAEDKDLTNSSTATAATGAAVYSSSSARAGLPVRLAPGLVSAGSSPLKTSRAPAGPTKSSAGESGKDASVHAVVMRALRQHLLLHGARVSENLHHGVTHIVMRLEQLGRACKIRERIRQLRTLGVRSYEKRLVTPAWVQYCVQSGRVVEPCLPEHSIAV